MAVGGSSRDSSSAVSRWATRRPCGPKRWRRCFEGHARRRERVAVAGEPLAAGDEAVARVGGVAEERDPLVAELEQVPRRQLAALDVVDHHARQSRVVGVDEHDRDAAREQRLDLLVARRQRDDQQAVRAVDRRALAQIGVALRRVGDVADHELERGVVHGCDHAAHPLHRRRVGEERDHHPERLRRAGGERPRAGLRAVGEVVHRLHHALARGTADLTVVEDTRDRARPHPRARRHVRDRHAAASSAPEPSGPVRRPPHPGRKSTGRRGVG